MQKFWMCFAPSKTDPTHRHPTLLEADAEAARLALKLKTTVVVLEAVGGYEPVREVVPVSFEQEGESTDGND